MLRLRRVLTPKKPPPTPEPEVRRSGDPILVPFQFMRIGGRFRTGVGPSASWLCKVSETHGHPLGSDMQFAGDRQFVASGSLVVAWSDGEITPAGQGALRLLRTVGTRLEESVAMNNARGRLDRLAEFAALPPMPVRDGPECIITEFGFVRIGHRFYDRNPDERDAEMYRRDVGRVGIMRVRGQAERYRLFEIDAPVYVTDISALDVGGLREYQNRTPRQVQIR